MEQCLACPEVNSQEILPSAQTERMTSFPSYTPPKSVPQPAQMFPASAAHALSLLPSALLPHVCSFINTFLQAMKPGYACSLRVISGTSRNAGQALCMSTELSFPPRPRVHVPACPSTACLSPDTHPSGMAGCGSLFHNWGA